MTKLSHANYLAEAHFRWEIIQVKGEFLSDESRRQVHRQTKLNSHFLFNLFNPSERKTLDDSHYSSNCYQVYFGRFALSLTICCFATTIFLAEAVLMEL